MKDRFGSRSGTIAFEVNGSVTKIFKTDKEIAEKLQIPLRQVRARLYSGVAKGIFVKYRVILYKLSPGVSTLFPK